MPPRRDRSLTARQTPPSKECQAQRHKRRCRVLKTEVCRQIRCGPSLDGQPVADLVFWVPRMAPYPCRILSMPSAEFAGGLFPAALSRAPLVIERFSESAILAASLTTNSISAQV